MYTRLLTGIGIQNFKTLDKYTVVSIRDLTILIGKNGSGKSSCWQILQLLECFNPEKYKLDRNEAFGIDSKINLKSFREYGSSTSSILYDSKQPLIFELYSRINILGKIIRDEQVVFRFEFVSIEGGNSLEISKFAIHTKDNYLYKVTFDHNEGASYCIHSDFWDQYILNILLKIKRKEFDNGNTKYSYKEIISGANKKLDELITFLNEQPDQYFEKDLQPLHINKGWSRLGLAFAVLFNEEIECDSTDFDEMQVNLYPQYADFVYQGLKKTFESLLEQSQNILFVNRRLIGHQTRFIAKTTEREKILELKPNSLSEEMISFLIHSLKHFSFKDLPEFSEDESGTLYYLKQGNEDLQNSGSGYWSITYIMYAIANAVSNGRKILILEEPEAHLHPDFQASLSDFLIDAVNKFGLTLIIETHSEYLTRRIQLRVFEAHNKDVKVDPLSEVQYMLKQSNPLGVCLKNDKVILNYFKHVSERLDNTPICMSIHLDKRGMLSKEYPQTFAGVASADSQLLLNLASEWNEN